MAGLPRYLVACLHTGKLALLAIMVSCGIVLQILACALYNNWWPMLTVCVLATEGWAMRRKRFVTEATFPWPIHCRLRRYMANIDDGRVMGRICERIDPVANTHFSYQVLMYVILPMPLIFFAGSSSSSLLSSEGDSWVNFTKFLTGASVVGSIAIPSILKHADVIGWGALAMELSSFSIFAVAILLCLRMNSEDEYGMF